VDLYSNRAKGAVGGILNPTHEGTPRRNERQNESRTPSGHIPIVCASDTDAWLFAFFACVTVLFATLLSVFFTVPFLTALTTIRPLTALVSTLGAGSLDAALLRRGFVSLLSEAQFTGSLGVRLGFASAGGQPKGRTVAVTIGSNLWADSLIGYTLHNAQR